MAVASGQFLPHAFLDAGWTSYSNNLSKISSAETSTNSDDEYDYVASLAEQIAHAMLDDDDCCEDTDQNYLVSGYPSNLEAQASMYDPKLRSSKATRNDVQARISSNVLSTAMLLPLCSEEFAYSSPDQFGETPHCKFAATDTILQASALGKLGFLAHGASERSQLLRRESPPHCRQQFHAAFMPLSQPQSSVAEKFITLASSRTSSNATNVSSPTSCSERSFQGMRPYHDSRYEAREQSNSRSRNGVRRKHESAKSAHAGLYQASQVNTPRWQSPLLELRDNAGAHAALLGHSPVRAEPTGTGVFLPRIGCSASSHRKKSESAKVVSRATQSANDALPRGGRHRERVQLQKISTAL